MSRTLSRDDASVAERLADFVTGLSFDEIDAGAVETVERAFVDTVGVMLAGFVEPAGKKSLQQCNVGDPFSPETPPPAEHALALGTASHALDYDDLSYSMDGHPSVVLVPPLYALAASADATGADAVTAYVAGYETACAIAEPVSPTHYENGWHATATFGVFASVAAAAKLLDLDREQVRDALRIAASMPAGTKANFGSMTKPLHAGLASRSGVTAARLARTGFTGGSGVFTGDAGFWELYASGPETPIRIGDPFRIEEEGLQLKAYPCCYFTHASIAAATSLADEHDFDPSEIERVDVTASPGARDALRYSIPETPTEAKFSMPYTVASALVRDRVGLATFEGDAIADPLVRSIAERVEFTPDRDLPYTATSGTVRVETASTSFEAHRDQPPGTHRNPLDEAELRTKFEECASRVLSPTDVSAAYDHLVSLSDHRTFAPLSALV